MEKSKTAKIPKRAKDRNLKAQLVALMKASKRPYDPNEIRDWITHLRRSVGERVDLKLKKRGWGKSGDPKASTALKARRDVCRFCTRLEKSDAATAEALLIGYYAGYHAAELDMLTGARAQAPGAQKKDHWKIVEDHIEQALADVQRANENASLADAVIQQLITNDRALFSGREGGFHVTTSVRGPVFVAHDTFVSWLSKYRKRPGKRVAQ